MFCGSCANNKTKRSFLISFVKVCNVSPSKLLSSNPTRVKDFDDITSVSEASSAVLLVSVSFVISTTFSYLASHLFSSSLFFLQRISSFITSFFQSISRKTLQIVYHPLRFALQVLLNDAFPWHVLLSC